MHPTWSVFGYPVVHTGTRTLAPRAEVQKTDLGTLHHGPPLYRQKFLVRVDVISDVSGLSDSD